MTSSTALLPSVRAAFGSLIDYAGLFPPATLPLAGAQSEYRAARCGSHAWMLGRFVIPAATLAKLAEPFDAPFSAIVDPDIEALNRVAALQERGAKVEALEIPLTETVAAFRKHFSFDEMLDVLGALEAELVCSGAGALPAFVEIPRTRPWQNLLPETLQEIARLGLAAKIRCGGVTADAFPSVDELAEFIAAACDARAPFKATAGLHHPVRRLDHATGFMMHGFLNLLTAAALAPRVPRETLTAIVAEEDPGAFSFDETAFAWRDQRVSIAELQTARRSAFISYGSCSLDEPVEDLTALRLLPPA
ncbi:MAG: hypothetical protein WB609_07060 [Candidatus Cybelea sp.]